MDNFRVYLAWVATFSMIGAPMGLEGCSSKGPAPVSAVQQASTGAQEAAPAAAQGSNQQPDTPAQMAGGQQPIQLPDVNLTPAGLDELLAPIALYPDPVLAVMLQASVDPQQVMDGGNWLTLDQNQTLKEAALDQASQKAGFTPVMQALLHYPSVVDMMCTQFDWTKQLGAAYSADPKSVLGSVQRLRATAVDNGALKTSAEMKVNVKQDQGQQIVEVAPANPKVVYVPQYDPQQVFSTTTTTTNADGSTTTTTTTNGAAPSTSTNTVVVQQQPQQQSGVSTGSAVLIGLLSFGAGIAVGAAINNNNYYYPSWGYGGVYYGGRPYYPPPYHPYYGGGWGPSYGYNRPVHYGNNNIYINNNHYNNNYYNRFNNNSNLNPNHKPMPVHYNNKPNGVYSNSMGNRPGSNQGVKYNRPNNGNGYQGNAQNRPGNQPNRPGNQGGNNIAPRPGNTAGAGGANNNWKGQTTYQGNRGGNNANGQARPSTGAAQTRPGGGVNTGANNGRPNGGAPGAAQGGNKFGNANVDRGYGQQGGGRPNTATPSTRPSTANTTRPSTGNASASRPTANNQMSRPTPSTQPASRPQSKPGGAFGGASNPSADRSASNRGRSSMGAPQHASGGGNKAAAPKNVKKR